MTTWTLVLFLFLPFNHKAGGVQTALADPIIVPGFATKEACDGAGEALRVAQKRTGPSACVEVKPAPCRYGGTLYLENGSNIVR